VYSFPELLSSKVPSLKIDPRLKLSRVSNGCCVERFVPATSSDSDVSGGEADVGSQTPTAREI
jgi:hypothetical protein